MSNFKKLTPVMLNLLARMVADPTLTIQVPWTKYDGYVYKGNEAIRTDNPKRMFGYEYEMVPSDKLRFMEVFFVKQSNNSTQNYVYRLKPGVVITDAWRQAEVERMRTAADRAKEEKQADEARRAQAFADYFDAPTGNYRVLPGTWRTADVYCGDLFLFSIDPNTYSSSDAQTIEGLLTHPANALKFDAIKALLAKANN